MNVIIIEDEVYAADQLKKLLFEIDSTISVLKVLDSVKSAITFLSKNTPDFDAIFMDIHLADGISFEIFEQVKIKKPIIFTTAFDQYSLRAFKLNSIDYLLKPIQLDELKHALDQLYNKQHLEIDKLTHLISSFTQPKSFKNSFLLQKRDELIPVQTDHIAFFNIDTGIVKATTFSNDSYIVSKTIEEIENELNPDIFFRVNRQMLLNKNAIKSIQTYFNGKLIVNSNPKTSEKIVVSKAKASLFKDWVNS